MCSVKSDRDTQMLPKEHPDSLSNDESSWSESPTAGIGIVLKKGPWTAVEDAILRDFVKKYGEGNWNAVQRSSGLLRCGKSCRLRWANHLRPELKKVAFTQEEEHLIIEMHAKLGNKWARMASLLPGRTDNEIKNYWNTRTKRRQRAGLPLYPSNIVFPLSSNENHPTQNTGQFYNVDRENLGVQQGSIFEMPAEFQLDTHKTTAGHVSYALPFSGIHSTCPGPYTHSFLNQGVNQKRARDGESESSFPTCHGGITSVVSMFKELPSTYSNSIYGDLGLNHPYDPDPGSNAPSNFYNFSPYSHLPGTVKMELPSLQYPETNYSNWLTTTDCIHVKSPRNVSFLSECTSPRSSGLLEALVHESGAINGGKKLSSEKSSCSSAITDTVESSTVNFCTAEWEEISNQRSAVPLANSSEEAIAEAEQHEDASLCSRPDALFESDWFLRSSQRMKGIMMNDAFAALVGDERDEKCEIFRQPAEIPSTDGTLSMDSLHACPWNSMPSVCQMPEHH
ncbi:Transcription factor GAMYB [Platanthera zijinensis]|uniref:Transcription factor GAMYB n=1 Tax=Platanthera zijinensis TaxID=2320716 RepID=A0AAP0BWN0_9ASPA